MEASDVVNEAAEVAAHPPKGLRLEPGEQVLLALRPSSWLVTFQIVFTLGLYIPWRNVTWYVVTDRRVFTRKGLIMIKSERSLPASWIQDASVNSTLGAAKVSISTAGGSKGTDSLGWLSSRDARALQDAILKQSNAARLAERSAGTYDPQPDVMDQIRKLAELRDSGAISNDEFETKKGDLLSRM